MKIPIAHLHGGEITEGAYDDSIRHAVTKLATLHFVAAEPYRRRVVQMGEAPDRVFLVGALGLDTLERTPRMSLDELAAALEFPLRRPFFLVTYHPATLAAENPASAMSALFAALERYPDHQVVITYPNADSGGRTIIPLIEAFAQRWPRRVLARPSLGMRAYTSAMALADAVVGNSSSGIIEAPSVGVPTVNVGARQKGRLAATSVLHCAADESAIASALERATSDDFRALCRDAVNPYGSGGVARAIVARLAEEALSPIKRFHDVT